MVVSTENQNEMARFSLKFKNIFASPFFSVVILITLLSCGTKKSSIDRTQSHVVLKNENQFRIDIFSTFPTEIDGCSCYFSNDSIGFKNSEYIYVNDYKQISFLVINGELTKFFHLEKIDDSTSPSVINAKNEDFEIRVEVTDYMQNGDETWLKTGVIKLTDKNGNTVEKTFYGECGC